jgi:hypothetical protein
MLTQKTLIEAEDSQLIREVESIRTALWAERYRVKINPTHKIDLDYQREQEKTLAMIEVELANRYPK